MVIYIRCAKRSHVLKNVAFLYPKIQHEILRSKRVLNRVVSGEILKANFRSIERSHEVFEKTSKFNFCALEQTVKFFGEKLKG